MISIKSYEDFFVAFMYSFIVVSIPWNVVIGREFSDLEVYYINFTYYESILDYKQFDHVYDYIFNEWLWHYSVRYLNDYIGLSLDDVFISISLFGLFAFSFYLKRNASFVYMLLLTNPLVISLVMSQLRITLAMGMLIFASIIKVRVLSVLLLFSSALIHTSSLIFVVSYFLSVFISKKTQNLFLSKTVLLAILIAFAFFVAIITGPAKDVILAFFGDRRVALGDSSSSFLYTLVWFVVALSFTFQNNDFFYKSQNCYSVIFAFVVCVSVFSGSYTSRFLAVSMPMILASIYHFKPSLFSLVSLMISVYFVLLWFYWLQVPLL